jgi:hypothetical protein
MYAFLIFILVVSSEILAGISIRGNGIFSFPVTAISLHEEEKNIYLQYYPRPLRLLGESYHGYLRVRCHRLGLRIQDIRNQTFGDTNLGSDSANRHTIGVHGANLVPVANPGLTSEDLSFSLRTS